MAESLEMVREKKASNRDMYTMLLNICIVLAVFAVSVIVTLAYGIFGHKLQVAVSGSVLLFMPVLFMVLQAVQLPLYFKFGYAKAKFVSIIPFAALMAGYMVLTGFLGGLSGLEEKLDNVFAGGFAYIAIGAAFLAIVFASYRLSLAFYKKREF